MVEGSSLWHCLELDRVCSEAFFKATNSSALRRTLLARLRPQPGPVETDELLMKWSRHNLKQNLHDSWFGPARYLGRGVNGYWLIHNRIRPLCAPTLLRRGTTQESETEKATGPLGSQHEAR